MEVFPSYKRDSNFGFYKCFYLYRKLRIAKGKKCLCFSAFEDFYRSESAAGGITSYEDLCDPSEFEKPPMMKYKHM
jgi:hypothetical protein